MQRVVSFPNHVGSGGGGQEFPDTISPPALLRADWAAKLPLGRGQRLEPGDPGMAGVICRSGALTFKMGPDPSVGTESRDCRDLGSGCHVGEGGRWKVTLAGVLALQEVGG